MWRQEVIPWIIFINRLLVPLILRRCDNIQQVIPLVKRNIFKISIRFFLTESEYLVGSRLGLAPISFPEFPQGQAINSTSSCCLETIPFPFVVYFIVNDHCFITWQCPRAEYDATNRIGISCRQPSRTRQPLIGILKRVWHFLFHYFRKSLNNASSTTYVSGYY